MPQTKAEWISTFKNLSSRISTFENNKVKIKRLKNHANKRTTMTLYFISFLFTLAPAIILYKIDAQRGNIIEVIRYDVLPALIPGFFYFYTLLFLLLIGSFIYSLFALRREDSRLREKLASRLESRISAKISKLEEENIDFLSYCEEKEIPDDYINSSAIHSIYGYFKNHRVNNLMDAFNLYEHERQIREIAAMQSMQLSKIQASAEAAEASAKRNESYSKQAASSAAEAKNILKDRRR